jgi:DNA-binding NarL/FixJ family response regulator
VLLAYKNLRLNEGVRGLLETVFGKVFMVADQPSLLEGAARLHPTMVLIDLSLAQGNLSELLGAIRIRAPSAKLLVLSIHDEAAVADAALMAGADALVLTRTIATDLLPALDAVAAGQRYVSRGVAAAAYACCGATPTVRGADSPSSGCSPFRESALDQHDVREDPPERGRRKPRPVSSAHD